MYLICPIVFRFQYEPVAVCDQSVGCWSSWHGTARARPMNPVAPDVVPTRSGATRSDPACHAPPDAILECGPTVVQWRCSGVFSMTLCRSRRRQVVEMHYCRLFGWAHNPKAGGSPKSPHAIHETSTPSGCERRTPRFTIPLERSRKSQSCWHS